MAELPSASLVIDDEAGAFAGNTGYAVVVGCAESNADITPRVFSSTKSLLAQHGYSKAVDYAAHHFEETKLPVIFVALPKTTAGYVGSQDTTGVTGTGQITAAAGSNGVLDDADITLTVFTGGTIGTSQIEFDLSCDGGRSTKRVRLGTGTTYAIPYLGVTLSFGTGGTLVAGDVFSCRAHGPMWAQADLQAAREALAEQTKTVSTFLVAEEIANATFAGYITTEANAYETSSDRYVVARTGVRDLYDGTRPGQAPALAAKNRKKATGAPSVTFAEVGATGDTITRATGSFLTDGFQTTGWVKSVSALNAAVSGKITNCTATVITLDTADLVAEVGVSATIEWSPLLTFAEVGATGDTITRSHGSWLEDGFAAGDRITVSGTALNNFTSALVTAATATVLTLDTQDLAAEEIGLSDVTISKVLSMSAWIAAQDTAFASVDTQKRIDIGIGRARKTSRITGWSHRRPAHWALSLREYTHDLHIPTYRKSDGQLDGWSLEDAAANVVELDARTDAGALTGRFSALRTWANGPNGAFGALSLTRQGDASLLSRTHNMRVVNLACTVCQGETENAIGQSLVLDSAGRATKASLSRIELRVNSALQRALLTEGLEGPRASLVKWSADPNAILNVPGAELPGTMEIQLNGTLEKIDTAVRVQTGGA